MQIFAGLLLAFGPGIIWMWIIYRWDRFQPEPRWLVIRTFLLGSALAVPVVFAELVLTLPAVLSGGLSSLGDMAGLSLGNKAYQAFIVAGVTEEIGKFLVVRITVYRNRHFDEPIDGVVYSSAAALGFASAENIGYLIGFGWEVLLLRGFISLLGHITFSVMWGYPLALRKIRGPALTGLVWLGLGAGVASHGLYDFLLFSQSWFTVLVIPAFLGLVVMMVLIVQHARRISPFRVGLTGAPVDCSNCSALAPADARFCPSCGQALTSAAHRLAAAFCSYCGAPLQTGASFCTVCGRRQADLMAKDT